MTLTAYFTPSRACVRVTRLFLRYATLMPYMMNSLTFPILRVLADGQFHSGEALAKHFKVTRTTIWSAIQHAEALGVTVFSVRGRGYKLPNTMQLLNREQVFAAMSEPSLALHLEVHDHLDSTNSYLMKQASSGAPHATCVAALLQTQGKGRRGRSWQASLGASLTFSLLWRFQVGASALSGLSLVVGLGLIRALHACGLTKARLKWPNDVLVNEHKLAGILIELQGDMEGPSAAVIGIGVNLDLPSAIKAQIDQAVTDVSAELKQAVDPNAFLASLLKHLSEVLAVFEQQGFDALSAEWQRWHYYHLQPVTMLMPDGRRLQGVVQGVASDGVLLVETAAGVERFASGEISLRGAEA